ncbi:MAG: nucleotidyltransferase domain-containing protein [Lachnospiraceae bacterium]|nr:nucleotidyltransferase domain-containing protein [Lachnospiraceae bacterium]
MNEQMRNDLVNGLLATLPGLMIKIILYGSTARETASPESDIDIALLLSRDLTDLQKESLSDLIVDLNLKYDKVFSVIDLNESIFRKWKDVTPFYQNVEREGVVLWTAA